MKDVEKSVRLKTREIAERLEEREIFLSPQFHNKAQSLIDSVLLGVARKPTLQVSYDENSDDLACTSGQTIYLNAANYLSNSFSLRESRVITLLGMLFHEAAHCRYLDFEQEQKIDDDLVNSGVLFGSLDAKDDDEQAVIDEIYDALSQPEYRPIFKSMYDNISNVFSDVHDEYKMCHEFKGFVERGITFVQEALRSQSTSLEKMMEKLEKKKMNELSVMFALILHFARFGEIITESESSLDNNEFIQKLYNISAVIQQGSTTDSLTEKFTAINRCILVLWPYIKKLMDKTKKPKGNSQSNSQGNGSPQQGNGSPQQGNGSPQQWNGSPQQGNSSSQNSPSSQGIQNVLNSLQQGAANAMPKTSPAPAGRNTAKTANKKTKSKSGAQSMSNEQAQQIAKNTLKQISNEIAKAKAESEIEGQIQSDANVIINTASMTSAHNRKSISINRVSNITEQDKADYEKMMRDIKPISRALQKQMMRVIRDMREGYVLKHRIFGDKLEARDAYRLDSRMFSNKKLPQDVPDMAITLLIDLSGSMCGERIQAALKTALLIYDFAYGLGVPIMVCGHTNGGGGIRFYVYTDFEHVGNNDKYRLLRIDAKNAANRDGMAIIAASEPLSKRPEEVKLLICITDGQPNDRGYGGDLAKKDIQEIVRKYRHKGIQTFAAAIGSDKERIQQIYRDGYLDISDLSKLPKMLVKLIQKKMLS